ncbi:MAG TPA: cytochrome c3 family protein [Acidobacteriota bacterium]|nr:cytochrome c3 family protein [Acidobacteriota bacterium]HND17890.1 cytochrome c3 family protein [Acidobacteriota bacterium]
MSSSKTRMQPNPEPGTRNPEPAVKDRLKAGVFLFFSMAALAIVVTACSKRPEIPKETGKAPAPPSIGISPGVPAIIPVTLKQGTDISKFTHKSHERRPKPDGTPDPAGEMVSCESCHQREKNITAPEFPGHSACLTCHLKEFNSVDASSIGMCTICHQNLDTIDAPLVSFPARKSYNTFFDVQQHQNHVNYSFPDKPNEKVACAFCHPSQDKGVKVGFPGYPERKFDGALVTLVKNGVGVAFPAHPECYACHTEQGGKVTPGAHTVQPGALGPGNCAACHPTLIDPKANPPQPLPPGAQLLLTKISSPAYRYKFSHRDHEVKGMKCIECHNINSSYNTSEVPQPKAKAHLAKKSVAGQGCFSCHNGKRAFGDEDFNSCERCHSKQDLAGSSQQAMAFNR